MTMSEAVITAIIMAVSSIVCQILINRSNREKRAKEDLEKETKRDAEEAKKEAKPYCLSQYDPGSPEGGNPS